MPFDPEDLELAFQLHVVDLVVGADRSSSDRELRFVDQHFPREVLVERGFVGEDGARTQRFHDAAVEAATSLPATLDRAAKLDLLEACFRLAVVDRELRIGEASVLLMAARLLGLSDPEFDRFLDRHPQAAGMSSALLDDDPDDEPDPP